MSRATTIPTAGLLLVKYASNGTQSWQRTIDNGFGHSVVVNSVGDVFVLGNDYNLGGNMFVPWESNSLMGDFYFTY